MRLLFFSDIHLAERPPAARLPSYTDDIFSKLAEVKEIAATCDVSIMGGDTFHTPSVPHGLVRRLISFLRDWPCPLYIVVGNHDLPADGMAGLDRTALGVVLEALSPDASDRWPEVCLLEEDESITDYFARQSIVTHVQLSAGHWTPNIDSDPNAFRMGTETLYVKMPEDRVKIKVAHCMVMTDGADHPFPCHQAAEIETDADIILCGHTHWQTGPVEVNGTLYVGPGSIARTQRSEGELRRQVQVLVLTITKDAPVEVEMIPLRLMRPSAEVFADAVEDRGVAGDERFAGYVSVLETGLGVGDGVEEALAVLRQRAPVGVAELCERYLEEAGL